MTKTWTIIALLKQTQNYLASKAIPSARLDAELLLAHCLAKDRVRLYMDFECPVTDEELARFRELVRRRARREPLAYILGLREFRSISLKVNRDVLIPRPETEIVVDQALEVLNQNGDRPERRLVLDIGTGSAAIALALAHENEDIWVCSIDISPRALKIARENVYGCGLDDRVVLLCGDCISLLKCGETFDLIVSNPPYVCSGDIDGLEPEIRIFEPRVALDGGKDGLDFYRKWIPSMVKVLKRNGWVILEIGEAQASAVLEIFETADVFAGQRVVKDYAGRDRVVMARKR